MTLSLNNIGSSYPYVHGQFAKVRNWEEAKIPLAQIASEINTLNTDLLEHLGSVITDGFKDIGFSGHDYRQRLLVIQAKGRSTASGPDHKHLDSLPPELTNSGISIVQIIESQKSNKPDTKEIAVRIESSSGAPALIYAFKAQSLGEAINKNNLVTLHAESDQGNRIHYSSTGTAQDANDPKIATPEGTVYQARYTSFATREIDEIPEHALTADEQGHTQLNGKSTEQYHRYLSQARGWNQPLAAKEKEPGPPMSLFPTPDGLITSLQ